MAQAYFDSAVRIPDAKGKIITSKRSGGVYVLYQYAQEYDPVKQYAIPKRTTIGKMDPKDHTLM